MLTRHFVTDGFHLPTARSDVSWEDEDTVLVATDFGEGTMSAAGFPLVIKRWRRGTLLDDAETVYTGSSDDMVAFSGVDRPPGYQRTVFYRQLDNRHRETLVLRDGELVRLDVPADAPATMHRQWLLIVLATDWAREDTTYRAGTVLVTDLDEFLAGTAELRVVFEPDAHTFVQLAGWTRDHLVVHSLQDVVSRLDVLTPGTWQPEPIKGLHDNTDTGIHATRPTPSATRSFSSLTVLINRRGCCRA
jgi:prolyl oligopeptidase